MNEFNYLYKDEFFIISSEKLNEVESKFYGFAINDDGVILENPSLDTLDGNGCYIYIHKENDKISIYQDFSAAYGLFVYQNDRYFAISNSFFMLSDYLKDKFVINLNSDYANALIPATPCSNFFKETLVEEIQILPHDYIIQIDINNASLEYTKIDYEEKTIPVDSKECLDILDKWYYRWVNVFNYLYENANNMQFSLSGGFDSRVLLTLLMSSDVDLNNINILTFISEKPSFKDDYAIASEMAKGFGFELNKDNHNIKKYYFKDLATSINLSFYLRGGFAKQMYWKNFIYGEKNYHIRGLGGELLRNFYTDQSIDAYIVNQTFRAQDYSIESAKSTKRILERTFDEYSKRHENFKGNEILNMHYMYTRNRYYSGTQITEEYLTNNLVLSPLMDPLLNKIHVKTEDDEFRFLLPCLIFLRYYPDVLKYRFEGNRKINDSTMSLAHEINNISPFIKQSNDSIKSVCDLNQKTDYLLLSEEKKIKDDEAYYFLKSIFDSEKFKKLFSLFFSKRLYDKIYNEENKLFPDSPYSDLNLVIAVMKIIESVMFSHMNNSKTTFDWFTSINDYPIANIDENRSLRNMNDVRIDFKNHGGKDNDIIVLDISDYNVRLLKPGWFTNSKGIGLTVESAQRSLKIQLKAVCNGNLRIGLKSRDVWDENHKRIEILYEKVLINNENVLNEVKKATHDNEILINREVFDGDIINFHVEWKPL